MIKLSRFELPSGLYNISIIDKNATFLWFKKNLISTKICGFDNHNYRALFYQQTGCQKFSIFRLIVCSTNRILLMVVVMIKSRKYFQKM